MKKFFEEFKAFAMRGNVIDMAVGVVIGGAFGKITTSLVNDIIMPLISMLTGGIDFSAWKWVLKEAVMEGSIVVTPEVAVNYGNLIAVILDFIIIAFAVFCMVKAINKMHDKLSKPAEPELQVVTTGAGNPGKYVPMWKAAGIKVIPVVAAAVLAKHLEPLGIDAVIAEGTESGGHVGEMTTMALVPQVVDAVSVPVIAAGGIADGRQLAAALALGACGVQVGTCLLASEECPIHENYKAALLKAKDSDTIVTGRSVGAPVRVLKNRMSREYVRQEKAGADKMELEKYTLGSLRRAVFEGDTITGSLMAGQVAGMLHEVRPVADILNDLWEGGRQRIAALNELC